MNISAIASAPSFGKANKSTKAPAATEIKNTELPKDTVEVGKEVKAAAEEAAKNTDPKVAAATTEEVAKTADKKSVKQTVGEATQKTKKAVGEAAQKTKKAGKTVHLGGNIGKPLLTILDKPFLHEFIEIGLNERQILCRDIIGRSTDIFISLRCKFFEHFLGRQTVLHGKRTYFYRCCCHCITSYHTHRALMML